MVKTTNQAFFPAYKSISIGAKCAANISLCTPTSGPLKSQENAGKMADLTILGAAYGLGCKTKQVRSLCTGNVLNVTANNETFGDTWPGQRKSLVVVYQYTGYSARVAAVKEGEQMHIVPPGSTAACTRKTQFGILGAAYGVGDVTTRANSLISDGKLEITPDNNLFPDSWHGQIKTFVAVFQDGDSKPYMVITVEGNYLSVSSQ